MKISSFGVLFVALSLPTFSHIAKADSPTGTAWGFSKAIPANGKILQFDLDGDGKKESISLVATGQAADDKSSTYRLKINGVVLDEVWPAADIEGHAKVVGFTISDLNVRDRSKEIVVFGPEDDSNVSRIYAWRGGKIRRVLSQPIFIERFNGDGTITELKSSGWSSVRLPYRLNGQGELKLVPQPFYPLIPYQMTGEAAKPARILKNVFFHLQPNSQSLAFEVKKGSSVAFDRSNNKGWVGARINGRIGWVLDEAVNGDDDTFEVFRAG